MAGIYIHLPFCKQKCYYCNFYSTVSQTNKAAFLKTLVREISMQKAYLNNEEVNTIYFGGGTPTLLNGNEIEMILKQLFNSYQISPSAEISMEANPDDINLDKCRELADVGINRLSIGVQSFFNEDLKYLHRVHDSGQAHRAIESAILGGFQNLTIDLIYGIPTLSIEHWKQNLKYFLDFQIPHLSAYALTIEPKTPLQLMISKNKLEGINEAAMVKQFKLLIKQTRENDFIHYEISNFAKAGFFSKHNSLYWLGGNYLGLGPSAHSYNGISRQWNLASLSKYLSLKNPKNIVYEKEVLTTAQKFNEYVMTSIRTSWGCNLEHIAIAFGEEYKKHCILAAKKHISLKKLILKNGILTLSDKGKLFADGITADLFYEDKQSLA